VRTPQPGRSRTRAPLAVTLVLASAPAHGQDSRAAEIAAEQDRKAANLHPYKPPKAEQILTNLEEGFLAEPGGFARGRLDLDAMLGWRDATQNRPLPPPPST